MLHFAGPLKSSGGCRAVPMCSVSNSQYQNNQGQSSRRYQRGSKVLYISASGYKVSTTATQVRLPRSNLGDGTIRSGPDIGIFLYRTI
jgi:hypothetical protein